MSKNRLRLDDFEPGPHMGKDEHIRRMTAAFVQLRAIQTAYMADGRRAIVLFEGWDGAGKGSTIRQLTSVLDPRYCKVWPIAAPSPQEQGRHYLYRFWQKIPEPGTLAVFDRSWYGRVLVERVEKFTPEADWKRGYDEINEFERLLTDDGVRIVKIFLHISAETQLDRFRKRCSDPTKTWKMTLSDLENLALRPDYTEAMETMFDRTSTKHCPWRIFANDDKDYGQVQSLETVIESLSHDVDLSPRPMNPEVARLARIVLRIPE